MATAVPPESVPEVPRPTAPTGAAQGAIDKANGYRAKAEMPPCP